MAMLLTNERRRAFEFSPAMTRVIAAVLLVAGLAALAAYCLFPAPLYLSVPVRAAVPAMPVIETPIDGVTLERLGLFVPQRQNIPYRNRFSGMGCLLEKSDGSGYRVWLTGRNPDGEGNNFTIGRVDLDKDFQLTDEPVTPDIVGDTDYDRWGCFNPYVVRMSPKRLYMYYPGSPVAEYVTNCRACLAISEDEGLTWKKYERNPLLTGTGRPDEVAVGTHCVFRVSNGWRMIYTAVSERQYAEGSGKKYVLRCADSPDGLTWSRPADNLAFDFSATSSPACPCVWQSGDRWLMAYCLAGYSKNGHYRVRLAESHDEGRHWADLGQLLETSSAGWDSSMTEYPRVIPWKNDYLLMYSGNDFGGTGLGLARLQLQ